MRANLLRRLTLCYIFIQLLSNLACHKQATNTQGMILKDVPPKVETGARYLFFLHGKIVEDEGVRPTSPKYGVYEYEKMLDAFKSRGFAVISEARAKDTDAQQYAAKVVSQIQTLLKAGVAPGHITVVGASKGAVITMMISTALKNREVNFVLMDNCNDEILRRHEIDLWGNVLSIYDINDEIGQTCQKFFDKATGLNRHKEIELKIGIGHGILYQPLKEWVEPTVEWASQ
ncbi:MAG: alpha/beta hydrolase [Acidobacteria bacterium]|nr:alpha/beta hydrolase [Acidobacteriota bacterium]